MDSQFAEFNETIAILKYPCNQNTNICTPYKVEFQPGIYLIELWGASGGYTNSEPLLGGYGAYTSGYITLKKKSVFYFYLGQQGKNNGPPTYNGGGRGSNSPLGDSTAGSGGGASDMRYISGEWNDTESLKSRIIVSAGGAGSAYYYKFIQGGHGGAITGYSGTQHRIGSSPYYLTNSVSATNILGGISGLSDDKGHDIIMNGSFGIGANPYYQVYGSGGGGGYYGGGAGNVVLSCVGSGSGGSSFISGYKNCNAIAKEYTCLLYTSPSPRD